MTEHEEDTLMEVGEAVIYLAKKWGMQSYKVSAFKTLRYRWGIEPDFSARKTTFWRRSTLDRIPKPDRNKSRGPRKRVKDAEEDSSSSLLPKKSAQLVCANTLEPRLSYRIALV